MGMMAWAASCPCVVFCSFHRSPSTAISLLLLLLLLLFWCSASAALPFSCIPHTPGRIRISDFRAFVFPSAFIGRQVRSCGVQTGPHRVKLKGRENWLREVCRQAGKHSHESQFEGRLWTHFQMDFVNTVQIIQGKASLYSQEILQQS